MNSLCSFCALVIYLFILNSMVLGFDYNDHHNDITDQRLKIVILPEQTTVYKKVSQQLSQTLVHELTTIPRFRVMNTYLNIGADMRKMQRKSDWSKIESGGVQKVLFIAVNQLESVRNFVPSSRYKNKPLISDTLVTSRQKKIIKENRRRWRKDGTVIVTVTATIQLKLLNVADTTVEKASLFVRSASGPTKHSAMRQLIRIVGLEIKRYSPSLYLLESEVVKSLFDRVVLRLGRNMGIRKGMRFYIRKRGRTEIVGGNKYKFQGDEIALVKVTEVGDSVSVAYIQRQWDRVDELHQAKEMTNHPAGLRASVHSGLTQGSAAFLGHMVINPLGHANYTVGLGAMRPFWGLSQANLTAVQAEISMNLRYPVARLFRLKPGVAYELTMAFQDDEKGRQHLSLLHGMQISLQSEWVLSRHWNFDVGMGFTFWANNHAWVEKEQRRLGSDHTLIPPKADVGGWQLRSAFTYVLF